MSIVRTTQLQDLASGKTVNVEDLATLTDLSNAPKSLLPADTLLFSNFRSQSDVGVYMSTSSDGYRFNTLSDAQMKIKGSAITVGGRDPMMFFKNGKIYMGCTFFQLGSYDVVFYTSTDGKNWDIHFLKVGGGIGSATVPAPGATHPCDQVWGPSLFETPDGKIYLSLTLPFGKDIVDINGYTIRDFRLYLCEVTDLENLVFGPPVLVTQTGNTNCQIDGVYNYENGIWHLFSKNDYNKHVEHWTSPSLFGAFTKQTDVITTRQSEAPWLVKRTASLPKYAIYSDDYVNGSYLVTESNDLNTWSAPVEVITDRNLRHGSVINASSVDAKSQELIANMVTTKVQSDNYKYAITASDTSFSPRDGWMYYATGTTQATITIAELGCQEFSVVIASQSPQCRLTFPATMFFDGVNSGADLVLDGATHGNKIITFKRFGNKFVTDATSDKEVRSIGLNTVSGFPNITNFAPIPGALYTTDGSSTFASTTNISSISNAYPDGTSFYIQVQSEMTSPPNGTVQVAYGSNVALLLAGKTISPGNLETVEFRKIANAWRLMK